MNNDTQRDMMMRRWTALKSERSSWLAHYREISDNILPRSGRFMVEDRNRGDRRHNKIYDNTGTRALKVLGAGLMGGATSPARPWFKLAVDDKDMMKSGAVKVWLSVVTQQILNVFQRSNTYRSLHSIYQEMGAFGTAASLITDDYDDVIRQHPLTAGEYCIATDWRGEVCTLYREFQKTVSEIVKEFGKENCSQTVRTMFDNGQLDQWVTLIHSIEPRADRDTRKLDAKNMAWKSVYWEYGCDSGKYLRESGFKRFAALCPRWEVSGGDIYGNSPGMEALGDVKQLQMEQISKGKAIRYQVDPPLQVPMLMKNQQLNTLPGGVSYYDGAAGQPIAPLYQVNLNLQHLLLDMQDVRGRINSAFYTDLFLMLSNMDQHQMTATEIAERHEEKLLMLGPVIERLDNELLNPLVDNAFDRLLAAGTLPPPPPELHGQQLKVEYTSVLAQAQQAVGTNGIDRFVGNLGMIAQMKPDVLDKFDSDNWAEAYSQKMGVDPELIVPSDRVALIRQQRAQAQQQQAQAAAMEQASQTAKNLGQTPTDGGNAASNVLNLFAQGVG